MKAANENKDNGFKASTTYRFLQNLKVMPEESAMAIWKWQNEQKQVSC